MKGSEEGLAFQALCDAIDRTMAPVGKLDQGSGHSNRARRAKPAADVFSRNAGLSKQVSEWFGWE